MREKLPIIEAANARMKASLTRCALCPRRCGVNRRAGKRGYCGASADADVYSYGAHLGEEPPLSGSSGGSGTIFFAHCTMRCVYCQNYRFSQSGSGRAVSVERLAGIMLELERTGCHNVNLVSPTHYLPQILQALEIAVRKGLTLPIVYNTGGYELALTIRELAGIVDIYLPDMRYADDSMARAYSDAPRYVAYNRSSLIEMQRQVGDLVLDDKGIAKKGLIIRLLALPNDISGTIASMAFVKDRVSKNARLSIMSQYRPVYKAAAYQPLSRSISAEEYKNVVDEAVLLGLNEGWIQEMPDRTDTGYLGTNIKPRKGP